MLVITFSLFLLPFCRRHTNCDWHSPRRISRNCSSSTQFLLLLVNLATAQLHYWASTCCFFKCFSLFRSIHWLASADGVHVWREEGRRWKPDKTIISLADFSPQISQIQRIKEDDVETTIQVHCLNVCFKTRQIYQTISRTPFPFSFRLFPFDEQITPTVLVGVFRFCAWLVK